VSDEPNNEPTEEPETFDRAYVERVRAEAADHRTKANEQEALATKRGERVLALEVERAAREVLVDGDDLLRHVEAAELLGDDGEPDPAKIAAAATQLAEQKPHLAARRPPVDVGAGPRGTATPEAMTAFGEQLRGAAR
jgi:hypothetical protein